MAYRNHLRTEHNIIYRSGGIVFTAEELFSMLEAIRANAIASNGRGTMVSQIVPANRSNIAVEEPAADTRLILRHFDISHVTSSITDHVVHSDNTRTGKIHSINPLFTFYQHQVKMP